MSSFQSIRSVLLAILVIGAVSAVGPHATYGQFSDELDGSVSLTAGSTFDTNPGNGGGGGNNGGGGNQAFDDSNGNGVPDSTEETYKENELRNFDDPDANLVIPSGVGDIDANGWSEISITAASIESDADLTTQRANLTLNALDGDIRVEDSTLTVERESGSVNLNASDDVSASGTTIQTNSGHVIVNSGGAVDIDDATIHVQNNYPRISVTGSSVSAQRADLDTESGPISLTATAGGIDATDADLQVASNSGQISLTATGDVVGSATSLQTDEGAASVDAGSTATVDDAVIAVSSGYGDASVTGSEVSAARADFDTNSGSIGLTATSGDIDAAEAGLQVSSSGGGITFDAATDVDVPSTTLTVQAGYGNLTITGQSVTATDADIRSRYGAIDVSATANGGGDLVAAGATMTVNQEWGSLVLGSNGDMNLNTSTLTTANAAATADLGVSNATLYVDEMTIQDDDTTLEYDPDGVTVVGTPNGGTST